MSGFKGVFPLVLFLVLQCNSSFAQSSSSDLVKELSTTDIIKELIESQVNTTSLLNENIDPTEPFPAKPEDVPTSTGESQLETSPQSFLKAILEDSRVKQLLEDPDIKDSVTRLENLLEDSRVKEIFQDPNILSKISDRLVPKSCGVLDGIKDSFNTFVDENIKPRAQDFLGEEPILDRLFGNKKPGRLPSISSESDTVDASDTPLKQDPTENTERRGGFGRRIIGGLLGRSKREANELPEEDELVPRKKGQESPPPSPTIDQVVHSIQQEINNGKPSKQSNSTNKPREEGTSRRKRIPGIVSSMTDDILSIISDMTRSIENKVKNVEEDIGKRAEQVKEQGASAMDSVRDTFSGRRSRAYDNGDDPITRMGDMIGNLFGGGRRNKRDVEGQETSSTTVSPTTTPRDNKRAVPVIDLMMVEEHKQEMTVEEIEDLMTSLKQLLKRLNKRVNEKRNERESIDSSEENLHDVFHTRRAGRGNKKNPDEKVEREDKEETTQKPRRTKHHGEDFNEWFHAHVY